ncbi:Ig-like domain-containing protein, partial [Gallibacterium anatis]|uniref:Ig-like domain-containing protein n=1 Tax=Gallibacterium anatis TaxID=750 RepID=UPI003006AEDF
MAHILLKVKKATQELEQFKIDSNSKTALHIRSLEGVDYQLIDENTGLGPDKVQVKRVGNDLQITFYDEDMQSPNVIIEDYYAHKANVIGEAVDKEIYSYIPESNKELAINALNNELISTVVLPVHNVGLAFNPAWFLTIPTAGLISLFTGHSHNSSSYETVDIKAPTVEISADKTALKIGEEAQITFTFSEVPKDFDLDDIEVKGGTLSHLQPTADGKIWTAVFTPNANFEDIAELAVAANSYTDAAGNKGQASEAVNVSVDTVAPTVEVSVNNNALKIGETATVTFTFSEAPSDFTADDIEVTEGLGSISNLQQSGTNPLEWTATFTPSSNYTGSGSIQVKADSYTDAAGNKGQA